MTELDKAKKVEVTSYSELRQWLLENHTQSESVWLVTYKKVHPNKYVSRDEVLDALVSFGWTDGIRRQLDESRTMQLISPRKAQIWAGSYKSRAERLIESGEMHAAGLASIDEAKSTGNWEKAKEVDELIIPLDLKLGLESEGAALENFMNFPPSTKRNILRWLSSAKKEETRTKKVSKIVDDAARNVRTPVNGAKK